MRVESGMRVIQLVVFLCLTACSTAQVVSVDKAPGVDLTAYHTYNFLDSAARNEEGFQMLSPRIPALKTAVAQQLEQRGYRLADEPDLWVNIGVMVASKVQTRQTYLRDAPLYMGQRRYHWESQDIPVRQYQEGTTTVDIVDAARNQLIWKGAVTTPLSKQDPQDKELKLSIATLFKQYPVPVR